MIVVYVVLICLLIVLPVNEGLSIALRVALYIVVGFLVYQSSAPKNRGIQQLIESRSKRRLKVIRYRVMKVFWLLYKGFLYVYILISILQLLFPGK